MSSPLLKLIEKFQHEPHLIDEMLQEWDDLQEDPAVAAATQKLVEQRKSHEPLPQPTIKKIKEGVLSDL